MLRLVAVAGNSCLIIRSLIVLLIICWLVEVSIFIDFNIKRGVRKLPQSVFLVEVGPAKQPKRRLCRPL